MYQVEYNGHSHHNFHILYKISNLYFKENELDLAMAKSDVFSSGFNTALITVSLLVATIKNYKKNKSNYTEEIETN